MNEKRMRLDKVVVPEEPPPPDPDGKDQKDDEDKSDKKTGTAKVISLTDLKKQK